MGLLDRLRATPWHAWLAIGLGFVGAILAYRAWQNHQASAANASIVPVGGTDTPNYASLGAGQSVQGNQLLDALSNLSQLLTQLPNGQHTTPDPASGGPLPTHAAGGTIGTHGSARPAKGSVRYYTVRAGDTLSGIASRYGTSWQTLYQRNRGTIDNTAQAHGATPYPVEGYAHWIYPGERIRLN